MIDVFAAASVHAAMRQDFPDHFEYRIVREQLRRRLALHEAFSLYLMRWNRPPHTEQPRVPMMLPPL
jgi:hypothetical protein